MKKKLEAELMSLAHKTLRLKNRSDLHILLKETQKLQEKLSVLVFLEDYSSETNPPFSIPEAQEKVVEIFENSVALEKEPAVIIEEKKDRKISDETPVQIEETIELPEITVDEKVIIPEPVISIGFICNHGGLIE